jgi:phage-related protein
VEFELGELMRFTLTFVDEEEFERFLNRNDKKIRAKILAHLENVETTGIFFSVDHLEGEINEFRVRHGSNIARICWAYDQDKRQVIIITHGFIKKTQKTPKNEIDKAKRLLFEYLKKRGE